MRNCQRKTVWTAIITKFNYRIWQTRFGFSQSSLEFFIPCYLFQYVKILSPLIPSRQSKTTWKQALRGKLHAGLGFFLPIYTVAIPGCRFEERSHAFTLKVPVEGNFAQSYVDCITNIFQNDNITPYKLRVLFTLDTCNNFNVFNIGRSHPNCTTFTVASQLKV